MTAFKSGQYGSLGAPMSKSVTITFAMLIAAEEEAKQYAI